MQLIPNLVQWIGSDVDVGPRSLKVYHYNRHLAYSMAPTPTPARGNGFQHCHVSEARNNWPVMAPPVMEWATNQILTIDSTGL